MSGKQVHVVREKNKRLPGPRALSFAFFICLLGQATIALIAVPHLKRVGSLEVTFLLCVFLPVGLAFPVLYRSSLLRHIRSEARAGIIFLVSYAVFGVALGSLGGILFALSLLFGVRI